LRITSLFVSCVTLLSVIAVISFLLGNQIGLLTGILLAADPVFAMFSRQGHYTEGIFTLMFFWLGLFFILLPSIRNMKNWEKFPTGDNVTGIRSTALDLNGIESVLSISVGTFVWGVGLFQKITIIWLLIGTALSALVIFLQCKDRRNFFKRFSGKNVSVIIAGFSSFLLGAMPLIYFNMTHEKRTISRMVGSLLHGTSKDGINNLDYLHNLYTRGIQLSDVILGGRLTDVTWDFLPSGITPFPGHNYIFAIAAISGWFLMLYMALGSGKESRRNGALFIVLLSAAAFLLSPFSVSGFWPNHLVVLIPAPQIATAYLLTEIQGCSKGGNSSTVGFIAKSLLFLIVAWDAALILHYHFLGAIHTGKVLL
jgi:hypothetical protein